MATSKEFIEYVCDQLRPLALDYRKMFGDYAIYLEGKTVGLVCDDRVFVKKWEVIADLMQDAECAVPYEGGREWYVLDIDNGELAREVLLRVVEVAEPPKKRKRR